MKKTSEENDKLRMENENLNKDSKILKKRLPSIKDKKKCGFRVTSVISATLSRKTGKKLKSK